MTADVLSRITADLLPTLVSTASARARYYLFQSLISLGIHIFGLLSFHLCLASAHTRTSPKGRP